KGLSFEEKRKRIEKIFHDSGEFYQLKDIEKIGPKKGVVSQSIKEVLMSLVDDGLVVTDKIGTSNYFWSYPSEAMNVVTKEKSRQEQLRKAVKEAEEDREETEERQQLLTELDQLNTISADLRKALEQYKQNDPQLYQKKASAANTAKEAANRWTENVWEIQSFCVNRFGMERALFDKTFGIQEDFDTIE
ncbi:meiotic nuclear division protein 1, partial [Blakeslea trispora]